MKKFKTLLMVCTCLMCSLSALAQGSLSVHLGPSFPIGKFGDDDSDNYDEGAGLAGIGFGFGAQYLISLEDITDVEGLGAVAGIDFIFHGYDSDAKKQIEENNPGSDFKFPTYLTIPILLGAAYSYEIDEVILLARLGLLINLLKMSKLRWDEPGDDEYIERYDLATHLGFAIGAAILIRQQYEIALNLMTMGEHHVKGEVEYGSIRDALDMDQKVALITLTIGYILNGS